MMAPIPTDEAVQQQNNTLVSSRSGHTRRDNLPHPRKNVRDRSGFSSQLTSEYSSHHLKRHSSDNRHDYKRNHNHHEHNHRHYRETSMFGLHEQSDGSQYRYVKPNKNDKSDRAPVRSGGKRSNVGQSEASTISSLKSVSFDVSDLIAPHDGDVEEIKNTGKKLSFSENKQYPKFKNLKIPPPDYDSED